MSEGPEHGARFELSRQEIGDGSTSYGIVVRERDVEFEARAIVGAAIDLQWTTAPPRWIDDTTLGFLKTLRKNHAGDASWPARLVRWRAERE